LLAARSLPSPRTHYRKRLRLRRTASGRSLPYNLRFPGQYYQAETGLNQNYNRDYDPLTDRLIESDQIGLGGGSYSTYAYANENPISIIDPSGLAPPRPIGGPAYPVPVPPLTVDQGTAQGAAGQIGDFVDSMIGAVVSFCSSKTCPECTPYKKGTIGWTRLDTTHGHYPIKGPHLHLRQVNQRPSDCKCFWNDADPNVAPPPPHPDWIDLTAGEPPLSP
jgi:RHS repeat-associated protein